MARDDRKTPEARLTYPDGSPLRDKDNAAPVPKPQMRYSRPEARLAPAGALGIRNNPAPSPEHKPAERPDPVTLTFEMTTDDHVYMGGYLTEAPEYTFTARTSDGATHSGYDGSRVDQLALKHEGEIVMRHNAVAPGTDIPLQGPEHHAAVEQVMSALDPERSMGRQDPAPDMPQPKEAGLAIDAGEPEQPWIEGRVVTMPGYSFHVRATEGPTPDGIEGGKVTALELRKDGEVVARYQGGDWEIDPTDPESREALQRVRNGLDDGPAKPFQGYDRSQDKDHGMDR